MSQRMSQRVLPRARLLFDVDIEFHRTFRRGNLNLEAAIGLTVVLLVDIALRGGPVGRGGNFPAVDKSALG